MAMNLSLRLLPRCVMTIRRCTSRNLSQRCNINISFNLANQASFCRIGGVMINKYPQHAYVALSRMASTSCNNEEKPSLFKRFKQMYRDYWYVLLPVHLVTSAAWFGGFYYLAKSGIDIVGILESWNVSERITNPLKDSSMGYIAVSYACYKIATPLRYTVTLGGTTISINYLKQLGYIRPVPSRQELKYMYIERKENIIESMKDKKEEFKMKKDQLKDKRDIFMDDIKDKINDSKETFRDGKESLSNFGKIKLKNKT